MATKVIARNKVTGKIVEEIIINHEFPSEEYLEKFNSFKNKYHAMFTGVHFGNRIEGPECLIETEIV